MYKIDTLYNACLYINFVKQKVSKHKTPESRQDGCLYILALTIFRAQT